MKYHTIVTIGRQYGSGGRYIASMLAERMEIPYYDKELLAEASKDSGISQQVLENYDEKYNKGLLFSLMSARGDSGSMYLDMPLNHRIFLAQFDTIRRIAGEGPCILVGRCADYVLRDHDNVLNVFIRAPEEDRMERIIEYNHVDPMKAEEILKKTDRQRASYYNYYATGSWGDVNNYHLCLDSGVLGYNGCVEVILRAIEMKEKKASGEGAIW
ncbi:MAG: cytidylate kinase-like family protein [Clostridia bacterium]|nr:cytidylate kinase-like family protein [Clostridia bacterium]